MSWSGLLYAIHGFIGKKSDWGSVIPKDIRWVGSDLFNPHAKEESSEESSSALVFSSLAEKINLQARDLRPGPRVLLGYSLGARIALHCLEQSLKKGAKENSFFWDGVILVSAHPGLTHPKEREVRIESDQNWANRFLLEEWNSLMRDWNSQPVFQTPFRSTGELHRSEGDFCRKKLSEALIQCSLGRQKDFRPFLKSVHTPILWISGSEDVKFRELANEMATLNPKFQAVSIPNSGHRAPWEKTEEFGRILNQFLHDTTEVRRNVD